MSAYGAIPPRRGPVTLSATRWPLDHPVSITVHHVNTATAPSALATLLHTEFQAELERGNTYPQEYPIDRTAFDSYFFASDVFVAIFEHHSTDELATMTIESARAGRTWQDCFAGAYYVKPNYPGRSSHICNAGFLVPPRHRRIGIATALARSYLYYAPRLGFKASVFNLVYVNNIPSIKIWERLGFEKIGRVPHAGRLRRSEEDGGGEEYVDAWVIWKSFE